MRVLVTGGAGQLGRCMGPLLPLHDVLALDHTELDVGDRDAVEQIENEFVPDMVVNTAAMTDVDGCELDPDAAYRSNALALRHLGVASDRIGAHVIHVSTDFVFAGDSDRPYREWDEPAPASVYARSKLAGERELAASCASWAVVRTSWVFGRPGGDFISWVLDAARGGNLERVVDDERGSPTLASDLATMLARFAVERRRGLYHVTNQGSCTRLDLAREVLRIAGLDDIAPEPMRSADLGRPAERPAYSVLDNAALRLEGIEPLRSWQDAVAAYLADSGMLAPDEEAERR